MILKSATLVDAYDWVFPLDPALEDGEDAAGEIEAALESSDWDRLPLKQGMKPAIWRLEHLRGEARLDVINLLGREQEMEAVKLAARCAIADVSGAQNEDGTEWNVKRIRDPRYGFVLSPETFADLANCDHLINTIGMAVISNLTPKKS